MSTPKEGGTPANIVPISLRRAPEQGRFHGVKTPEAMRQQHADETREAGRAAAKELLGKRWGATVYENPIRVPRPLPRKPGEQRGEAAPSQPNPAEQQAPERRRTLREAARLAQDPELRSLGDELWGNVLTKGAFTDTIKTALYRYPDLPPDEALRRDRDDYQGFSFA
jgi:hypothetical protein